MSVILGNFINGEFVSPKSGGYLDNLEPATGSVLSKVPDSTSADVEVAVSAAEGAFPVWSQTPAHERSQVLLSIAQGIEDDLEAFAQAESADTGKPVALARRMDIPRAVHNLRFFATAILHTHTEAHATDKRALNVTLRNPRGICGLISPWNLPLYLFTWKIAPALATGNTAVAKPSELTPTTATMLAEMCQKKGLPAGVLNVVHGLGAKTGAAIVAHPKIRTLSFTGGTATGAEIARVAAPQFKKLTLELGGKNPTVIFADCDFDKTLDTVVRSSFTNQGQICLCGSRLLIEASLYPRFVEALVARVKGLHCGDPKRDDTTQGAVISAGHQEKILRYIALAKQEGGRILCGGGIPKELPERCKGGYFVEPTLVADLPMGCRVNQEEIFGPVVTVAPFHTDAEAIALANQSSYGLAASVWTNNLQRAHRMAAEIACGTVWVNTWLLRDLRVPFGGMNHSGVGREGGDEAIRFFTEPKNVCFSYE